MADMRALYYVMLQNPLAGQDRLADDNTVSSNENLLNQNFTILSKKIAELELRLSRLEK
ncbi:MAG: hypothetical protein SPK56_04650 [Eubacteriales bacterium]|nr:hypothetical protein [Clostridiales bacterium]MDY5732458.1 hypothetical protein [Eubacteriales bacterium]